MIQRRWIGVPLEKTAQWSAAFDGQRGIFVSSPCPLCGEATLRHYYHLVREKLRVVRDKQYIGVGSYWAWCASCGAYEHASSLIPADWSGVVLPVDHARLSPLPDELEDAVVTL